MHIWLFSTNRSIRISVWEEDSNDRTDRPRDLLRSLVFLCRSNNSLKWEFSFTQHICVGVFTLVSEEVGEQFGPLAHHFIGQLIMAVVSPCQHFILIFSHSAGTAPKKRSQHFNIILTRFKDKRKQLSRTVGAYIGRFGGFEGSKTFSILRNNAYDRDILKFWLKSCLSL